MPRKKVEATILVQFRVPVPLHRRLTTIARKRNMSLNALVRDAMSDVSINTFTTKAKGA